jgi:hypothetical protein
VAGELGGRGAGAVAWCGAGRGGGVANWAGRSRALARAVRDGARRDWVRARGSVVLGEVVKLDRAGEDTRRERGGEDRSVARRC